MAGLAAAFGSGAMTNSIPEIENSECILVTGSNTSETHPIIATRILRAKEKGAKIIVADPRRIHLSRIADIHVRQKLGTDVALLNGIMHVIVKKGWHDETFIKERCENFEALRVVLEKYTPEKAASISGVSADSIEKIAEYFANAKSSSILYAMGITQHTTGVDNVKSVCNLSMLTGNLGKESSGVNPLRGQNNVQGACDMGGLPNVYSGYQSVGDESIRNKMAKLWGVERLPENAGLTLTELPDAIQEGKIKGILIVGENPDLSDPDRKHVEEAFRRLEFMVVIDIFRNETARFAHVVLPAASFAEKEGTFTNTERRVQRVRKAIEPIGESQPDWWIIKELSNRFGYQMNYESPEDIMEEIRKVTPSYGGITYGRLDGEGLQWPCPNTDHPGTKFLHKDRFTRGKGLFHPIEYKDPAEIPDEEYTFWLTTGRSYFHYHTGTMTRNSPSLHREVSDAYVELNPQNAREMDIKDGDIVKLSTRRGEITTRAFLTERVEKNTVFMPFHFVESCANELTNPVFDPVAKIPEYKVCAVNVKKSADT